MRLTKREGEVLQGLAQGLCYKNIGRSLGIAPKTVQTHVASLYRRMNVINAAHAVAVAAKHGLIERKDS